MNAHTIAGMFTAAGFRVTDAEEIDDGYEVVMTGGRDAALHAAKHVLNAFIADPESGLPVIEVRTADSLGAANFFGVVRVTTPKVAPSLRMLPRAF